MIDMEWIDQKAKFMKPFAKDLIARAKEIHADVAIIIKCEENVIELHDAKSAGLIRIVSNKVPPGWTIW